MLNLKYKLYKTKREQKLTEMLGISTWIWNHSLSLQRRYYSMYGKYIPKVRLQKHIARLRRRNQKWQILNSQTVQEILDRQDLAYKRFFKGIAKRPPKFKSRRYYSSFTFKQSGYTLNGNVLAINKVGRFKFSKSREYENIKRVTVKRDSVGDFYVILTCDIQPKKYERLRNGSIGLDFGLTTYLTLSDESTVKNPEFLKQDLKILRLKSRKLSTKVKGSNNRKKAVKELNRVHRRISNRRSDFQWKLAHKLCRENKLIAIEDLCLVGMKSLWGRKVSDLAYGEFVLKLQQVAQKYGTEVVKIDRFFPSSKLCECGNVYSGLTLADRKWDCPSCGKNNDRDLNASKNILAEGIRLHRTKQKTSSEAS